MEVLVILRYGSCGLVDDNPAQRGVGSGFMINLLLCNDCVHKDCSYIKSQFGLVYGSKQTEVHTDHS